MAHESVVFKYVISLKEIYVIDNFENFDFNESLYIYMCTYIYKRKFFLKRVKSILEVSIFFYFLNFKFYNLLNYFAIEHSILNIL